MMRLCCSLVAVGLLFFCNQTAFSGSLSVVSQSRWVTVQSVIDGDTFKTKKGEKIRLLGMNTPETQHESSAAEPFGKEAKAFLAQLISGQQVRLSFDKEKKDRYGRTLAHVYLRDGLWVNQALVRQGFAHVYTFVPNISAAKALVMAEQLAIAEKLNMWSNKRWKVLKVSQLKSNVLGQFRVVQGKVSKLDKSGWKFYMGKLSVTIPKKYRGGFAHGGITKNGVKQGDKILVHGRLRKSRKGQWFLSIHTVSDVAHIK